MICLSTKHSVSQQQWVFEGGGCIGGVLMWETSQVQKPFKCAAFKALLFIHMLILN